MDGYRLDLSSPPDWRPLERLSVLLAEVGWPPRGLSADDFMYMGQLVSARRGAIHLYKHEASRSYLCLDLLGHCHRVSVTRIGLSVDVTGLRESVDRLRAERPSRT